MGNRGAKTCCSCRVEKPFAEFYVSTRRADGRQSQCIPCAKERDKARVRLNTPERRDRYYRSTYGISLDDVESMKADQGGACAICRKAPRRWVVDHCHETGKVRGLLCDTCNRTLGLLDDNHETLIAAAMYLLAHEDVLALAGGGGSHG